MRFSGKRLKPGLALVALLTCVLSVSGSVFSAGDPPAAVHPALDGNRGPFKVAFAPGGAIAVVTEYDAGAVAIVDCASGKILHHVPTNGEQPTGVAITPNGALAIVPNSLSGSIAFVDLKSLAVVTVPLLGMPWDVVLSPDGARAYVSVSQLDRVAVLDVASRKVIATIPTGRRPRSLSITPDGATIAVGNMSAGSISFLDTASLKETGVGRTPAVNLRGVAIFPDGQEVFAVAQRAQKERPTETATGIWSNQAFRQVPNGPSNGVQNLWLDLMGKDVADPDSVALDPQRTRAFITCSGGNSVNVVPIRGDGETATVENVGAQPRGLTFTPDGNEVWVANLLGNDITVLDPKTLHVVRRISLGPGARKDPTLLGRYLFSTASIVQGGQFTCNSCHPDGGTDGISWRFVHVPDALGKRIDRNVKSLRGEIAACAPFRWSGWDWNLANFVEEESPGLLHGPKLTDEEVHAIARYVGTLPAPPNPYRAANGALTPDAVRGREHFLGKAGCVACHTGPRAGGHKKAWIGTTLAGIDLQVPRLDGVYDSDPYLHDGSARTLEEVFTHRNPKNLHGNTDKLSETEMKELLKYVKEL